MPNNGITSISFVDSATEDSSASITAPADIDAGDLLVLLDSCFLQNATPDTVVPDGFTSIINTSHSVSIGEGNTLRIRQIASCKLAEGDEGSTSITGMDESLFGFQTQCKILLVFRPSRPATEITVADAEGNATSGNPASQTATASGGTAPLIAFGCYGAQASISPRTMSPAKDDEESVTGSPASQPNLWIAWKIFNSSPEDVTVDMDDEGNLQCLQSFYIEMFAPKSGSVHAQILG